MEAIHQGQQKQRGFFPQPGVFEDTADLQDRSAALFDAMRAIVDAPGYPLLTGYRSDFERHDREMLRLGWARGTRWLWLVRENGTDLTRLGVHPQRNGMAQAVISTHPEARAYLCEGDRVREITRQQALDELRRFDYHAENGVVRRVGGEVLARHAVTIHPWRLGKQPWGSVAMERCVPTNRLSLADELALEGIAVAEVIRAAQSFFCACREVTLDGENLAERIKRRQTELGHQPGDTTT